MKYDVIIIGGGIVGLATALNLLKLKPQLKLALLEKESQLAKHQTGHNSGVIHSGLYYKPGSLKAKNCHAGYTQLLEFCRTENIKHEICGKLVVATSEDELPKLDELYRRGVANGLKGLKFLTSNEILEFEPYCRGTRALWVPQAGIVNYSEVSMRYGELLLEMGAEIILEEHVNEIVRNDQFVEVVGKYQTYKSRMLVACAGLQSDQLALKTNPDLPLRIIPFRGEYYKLNPKAHHLVNNLIYPVPDPAFPFLGVHFTRMINGGVECGPNAVFAFAREGYSKFDFNINETLRTLAWPGFRKVSGKYWKMGLEEYYRSFSKNAFVAALQKLIPDINADDLEIGGAGIRAQACDREGNLLDDFNIYVDNNVIHVCNAPSPAATASLAIGETIANHVISIVVN